MNDQSELTEFDSEMAPEVATPESAIEESAGTILFRLSNDPVVNVGAADVARQLDDDLVDVTRTRITCPPGTDLERVVDQLQSTIESVLSNTHRRKTIAHEINAVLEDLGGDPQDSRRIPNPQAPFPGVYGDEQTIYEDDTVDPATLGTHGIPPDRVERLDEDEDTLYSQSPIYVGNSSSQHAPRQIERYRSYMDTFESALLDEFEPDDKPCMACGGVELPAYKGVDDTNLEYNQTFTILAASAGRTKPLGTSGSRNSAHRGRCVACLIAGFYYAFMPKIVRETGTTDNDTRIFTPRGDFIELTRIQQDLASLLNDIDEPVDGRYTRSRTLGTVATPSRGIQVLDLYETIYRHVNREYSGDLFETEIEYRPTALISYISEVERTRNISNIETIDPGTWAYDAVAQRTFHRSDGTTETYWPVQDVLWWIGEVEGDPTRQLTPSKDDVAFGILEQDLSRIERGITEITRTVTRAQGEGSYIPAFPHPGYAHHYFNTIMSASVSDIDSIDDESIDAIQDVASSVGRVFHGDEDIGVLIDLQNASTSTEFLRAFEKASMQAQKKSLDESPERWDTSQDQEVATVLKLIKDDTTFEPAKRMFVIHAALAAQYENVRTGSQEQNTSESES